MAEGKGILNDARYCLSEMLKAGNLFKLAIDGGRVKSHNYQESEEYKNFKSWYTQFKQWEEEFGLDGKSTVV